jgi:hypothetical protein
MAAISPTPAKTTTPSGYAPLTPLRLATSAGATQEAIVLSSCWADDEHTMTCGDTPPIVPAQPLEVRADGDVTLDFSRLSAPKTLRVQVYRFEALPVRQSGGLSLVREDDTTFVSQKRLAPGETVNLSLDLPPGEYTLIVVAQHFEGQTSQGFHITIVD